MRGTAQWGKAQPPGPQAPSAEAALGVNSQSVLALANKSPGGPSHAKLTLWRLDDREVQKVQSRRDLGQRLLPQQ